MATGEDFSGLLGVIDKKPAKVLVCYFRSKIINCNLYAVRRVSVRDVIEDKRGARWTHHATLPQPALVHAFSPAPLYRPRSMTDQ